MKKVLLMLPIALLLFSCNNGGAPSEAKETNSPAPTSEKMNIKVADLSSDMDVVCGMTITDDGIGDTTRYDGKLYGFCSKECKDEFAKDPAKYLSQK